MAVTPDKVPYERFDAYIDQLETILNDPFYTTGQSEEWNQLMNDELITAIERRDTYHRMMYYDHMENKNYTMIVAYSKHVPNIWF